MTISIGSYAKDNNIAKSTVYTKAKQLEIDTSNGLNDEAILQLNQAFNISQAVPTTALVVQDGNHQTTLTPTFTDSFHLESLRGDMTVSSYEDPIAIAQMVIAQNHQIIGAMQQHKAKQQLQLQNTQEALQLIETSNRQLEAATIDYKIDSRIQGTQINQSTQKLTEAMRQQQALGKKEGDHA